MRGFIIICEDSRSFLRDHAEILGRHRIRTNLCGDTGGDISHNGADGICDRGVLRNDCAGVGACAPRVPFGKVSSYVHDIRGSDAGTERI